MISDYREYELVPRQKMLFLAAGYLCIGFIVYLFYRSVVLSLAAGFLVRFTLPWYRKYLAGKRLDDLNMQFRDMLYSLSASITSGRQMDEALVEACDQLSVMYDSSAPIMMELQYMRRSILEHHASDRALLSDLARRTGSEDIRSFVQVYLTCRGTGGDLDRIIAHTTEIMTEKMEINEQIHAITAQKKLEGRMISLMPIAMLLALNLMSPSYISVLYTTLPGRLIMTFCLIGSLIGVWLMERISDVEI